MYSRFWGTSEPGIRLTISTYSSPGSSPVNFTLRMPFFTLSAPVKADSFCKTGTTVISAPAGAEYHSRSETSSRSSSSSSSPADSSGSGSSTGSGDSSMGSGAASVSSMTSGRVSSVTSGTVASVGASVSGVSVSAASSDNVLGAISPSVQWMVAFVSALLSLPMEIWLHCSSVPL